MWFINSKVLIGNEWHVRDIEVRNGIISDITLPQKHEGETEDLSGACLAPGFIDIHTHGGNGVDVNDASVGDLLRTGRFFAEHGVTSWNASILTDSLEQTIATIRTVVSAMKDKSGYGPAGIHLEGPFLSKEYKGAMPERYLKKPDRYLYEEYKKAAEGKISYITIAPELKNAEKLIRAIKSQVPVALGHSAATYDETIAAIAAGAESITHTANAMRLFHQHEPAIFGAALESDAYCEMICDGRHLHPGSVRIITKCKGLDRVILITDSIQAAGLPDGNYKLGINNVVVKDGDALLAETGVRAGSTLTLDAALRNFVSFNDLTFAESIRTVTSNPARLMRWENVGEIAIGKTANLVALNENGEVKMTVLKGRIIC